MVSPRPTALRLPQREEYGEPARAGHPWDALPWSEVSRWLAEARYYWLITMRRNGRPHVIPIWALWIEGVLYFATSPGTATARHLARSPHVTVHPDGGQNVAILEGVAERPDPGALPGGLAEAYRTKYGWEMDPRDPEMPFYAVRPRAVSSWSTSDLRNTATRWLFD